MTGLKINANVLHRLTAEEWIWNGDKRVDKYWTDLWEGINCNSCRWSSALFPTLVTRKYWHNSTSINSYKNNYHKRNTMKHKILNWKSNMKHSKWNPRRLIFIFSGLAWLLEDPYQLILKHTHILTDIHRPTEVRVKISSEDMKHNKGILIALWIRWDKLRSVNIPLMSYSYPWHDHQPYVSSTTAWSEEEGIRNTPVQQVAGLKTCHEGNGNILGYSTRKHSGRWNIRSTLAGWWLPTNSEQTDWDWGTSTKDFSCAEARSPTPKDK